MTSPPSSFNIAIVGAGNIFGPQFSGLRLVSGVDVKLAGIYDDDGAPLGSAQNSECKIDSIAQSWAVLSGVT